MEETLYTIPLTEAFEADDECPFCFVERKIENDLLDGLLGSNTSYMESDIRDKTDADGFCKTHFKKMFDYGNTLGNAWILKTHYQTVMAEMKKQTKMFSPSKASLFKKKSEGENSIAQWAKMRDKSCYICKRFNKTYSRYMDTFFYMYKKDDSMSKMIEKSKGFCLHHFGDICQNADDKLNNKQKEDFFPLIFKVMDESFERVYEDVSWLIEMFDYKNKDADWKNSKDALRRGMQKLRSGYPADLPHKKR